MNAEGKRISVLMSRIFLIRYQPDAGVGNLLIADVTRLLQLLVHGLDVLVQVGDGEGLPAVRTLSALVVVN